MAEDATVGPSLVMGDTHAPGDNPKASLGTRWGDWLSQPGNKAALMQFGVNMLQAPGWGQNFAGQVGSAIGAGAEAKDRKIAADQALTQQNLENSQKAEDLKLRREGASSEADLRSAQADYYRGGGARGGAGGKVTPAQVNLAYYRWLEQIRGITALDELTPEDDANYFKQFMETPEYKSLTSGTTLASATAPAGAPGTTLPPVATSERHPEGQTGTYNGVPIIWRNGAWQTR